RNHGRALWHGGLHHMVRTTNRNKAVQRKGLAAVGTGRGGNAEDPVVGVKPGPLPSSMYLQKQTCLSQRRDRWGEQPRTAQHYRHTVEKYAVRDIGVSRRGDAIRRPSILPYTGSQRSSCANGGVSVSQGSAPLQDEQNFSQEKDTCQAYR